MPVAGATELGRELHAAAVAAAGRVPSFIALLAESAASLTPAVGLLGRLRTKDGRVDLKMGGLLPLVGVARPLALRVGSQARSTPERIQDASAAGRLSPTDAETLVRIHRSLLTLVVEQQIVDLADDVPKRSLGTPSWIIQGSRRRRAGRRRWSHASRPGVDACRRR